MQNNILWAWALALMILSGMTACSAPEMDQTLEGRWHLVAYEALDGSWIETEPEHIARSVWIDCSDKGRRGRFEGQTVTNPIMGNYRLVEAKNIEVYDIAGTLRGEPVWGDRFWEAMQTSSTFTRDGDVLKLVYDDSTKQMIFNRLDD
ncbi:MAG: hypothetical protein AAFV07_11160 [Bacteroidota bacterium]